MSCSQETFVMKRSKFVVKRNVTLTNRVTNETITGDIINEDDIEGRPFFVIKSGARVMKLAKDAYIIKKQ